MSGTAVYPSDVVLPDMLHAAILRCPRAHARVKTIDASEAEQMAGVRAVLTGVSPDANIPGFRNREGALSTLFDDDCRFAGDEVAAVAAETTWQARKALRAIKVDYEPLPFSVTVDDAMKEGAATVFDQGNRPGPPATYERGDVTRGFAEADAVVEQAFVIATETRRWSRTGAWPGGKAGG